MTATYSPPSPSTFSPPPSKPSLAAYATDTDIYFTQAQLAHLFRVTKQNISHHIHELARRGQIAPGAVLRRETITARGRPHQALHFSLEVAMAVARRLRCCFAIHSARSFAAWLRTNHPEFFAPTQPVPPQPGTPTAV